MPGDRLRTARQRQRLEADRAKWRDRAATVSGTVSLQGHCPFLILLSWFSVAFFLGGGGQVHELMTPLTVPGRKAPCWPEPEDPDPEELRQSRNPRGIDLS